MLMLTWRDAVQRPEALSHAARETLDAVEDLFPMRTLGSRWRGPQYTRYVDVLVDWLDEARVRGLITMRERCVEIGPQLDACGPRYEPIDPE